MNSTISISRRAWYSLPSSMPLTVGNVGYDGFSFVDDLMHAGKRQWLFGLMGGVLFNWAT